MKKFGFLAALAWLILAFTSPGFGAASGQEVRIGVNAELTGDKPAIGASCKEAMTLLAAQIKQRGGLKVGDRKIPLKLYIEDNQDQVKMAVAAARQLINRDKVLAIIGPNVSSLAIPAAQVCEDHQVVMISPWSTNPRTTAGKKFIFRAGFVDDFQGRVMAKFARQHLKAATAAVLYDADSAYNQGIAQFFQHFFTASGGRIVAFASYTTGATDFSAQLQAIKAAAPQVLFLPNYYNEVGLQAKQARALGITCPILGSDSWESHKLLALAGHALEGCFFSAHYAPEHATPEGRKFIAAFTARYGKKPDGVAALTYDAGMLLCQAVSRAGSLDRIKVRDALAHEKYTGVTGTIAYKGTGDPVKSVVILQIKDGHFKYFATVHP